jgi:hypothetical protein
MNPPLVFALLGSVVLLGCEPPPVVPTADTRQSTFLSRIEGQVVVSSRARGNVVVLLFDADRPPPPLGTGRPISFSLLPEAEVFHGADAGDLGPFTAPFAFSLVAPGRDGDGGVEAADGGQADRPTQRYAIRGFVDGNNDFIPWYGVTNEVNTGDVGGAAIEPASRALRELTVNSRDPVLDVPVSFSDTALVNFDRPVFSVNDAVSGVGLPGLTLDAGMTIPAVIQLVPTSIDAGVVHQGSPVFLAKFIDDDGDGVPDDANGDGVPELWPRVVIRKLSGDANPFLDENDLDKNGVVDATGADYEHLAGPADGKPDVVALAAGIDPTPLAAQLLDAMGMVKTTPTPVAALRVVIRPLAVDLRTAAAQGGASRPLRDHPDPAHRPDLAGSERAQPAHPEPPGPAVDREPELRDHREVADNADNRSCQPPRTLAWSFLPRRKTPSNLKSLR